mgnify:CR=1 FL=1
MTTDHHAETDVAPARDRIARYLMIALGISSLAVFVGTAMQFHIYGPDRINVEAWRMFGFSVFAGLYFVIAFYPRRVPGLWELVFYHKAGVAIFLGFFVGATTSTTVSDTTSTVIVVDLLLAGTTAVAYVLAKGWRAWARTV